MIVRNSFINFLGLAAPLVVAIFAVPILIEQLGLPRFGALTLVWAVVSYFGLFDLGLGRALTQRLSVLEEIGDTRSIGPLVVTGSFLMLALGIVSGVMMALLADFGARFINGMPDQDEVSGSIIAMAIAMPAIILSAAFRGILEARREFLAINIIRIPSGIFTYAGPVLAIYLLDNRLDIIAWVLSLGRILSCILYFVFCICKLPPDRGNFEIQPKLVWPLCVSGGWLTVSNIVSPLMGYVDRFMIGSISSAQYVSFYSTPQEIVTKFWILPGALTSVLFPEFSAHSVGRSSDAKGLMKKSVAWTFIFIFPISLFVCAFADRILSFWIDENFSDNSFKVLQIMSVGILINCVAHVPFTLIQAFNKAKIGAIIHLVELPIFIFLLWAAIFHYGVIGAALAWMARMIIDTIAMFFAVEKYVLNGPYLKRVIQVSVVISVTVLLFSLTTVLPNWGKISIFLFSVSMLIIFTLKITNVNFHKKK